MSFAESKSVQCNICLDKLTEPIKYDKKGLPYCSDCWYVRPPSERATVKFVPSSFENQASQIASHVGPTGHTFLKNDTLDTKIASAVPNTQEALGAQKNTPATFSTCSPSKESIKTDDRTTFSGFTTRGVPDVSKEVEKDLAQAGIDIYGTLDQKSISKKTIEKSEQSSAQQEANRKKSSHEAVPESKSVLVTPSERHCAVCAKIGLSVYYILPDSDEALCESCFICKNCTKPICDDGFVRDNKGFMHPECIPREKCGRCIKEITGKFVTRDGKRIHTECFICQECKKELAGGSFYLRDNMEVCELCKNK